MKYAIEEYIDELEERISTVSPIEKEQLTTIIRELKEVVNTAELNADWDTWVNNE